MKFPQLIFWVGFIGLSVFDGFTQNIPEVEINNGLIKAGIYLPDSTNGYYRATRFDWSGLIPYLEYDGHSYFGKWFKNYDPLLHESVMGPVEEFAPLGYKETAIGDSFLKIGVGMLVKPKESRYNKFKLYNISDHGTWKIQENSNEVILQHNLNSKKYSYRYEKVISLPKGKPELILSHQFTNTGNTRIETEMYNHNFFLIDSLKIGPGYIVKLPFDIETEGKVKGIGKYAEVYKKEIRFVENLPEGNQVYIEYIRGYSKESKTYTINIENKTTRAGVKIQSNRPLSKLSFWSNHKTICPEPFISIKTEPGETFAWKTTYTFYTF